VDSRKRLVESGKELFSQFGYEGTSTAAIARQAKSAESQITRHFGNKMGLLDAVFEESWEPLLEAAKKGASTASTGREAVLAALVELMAKLSTESNIATILFLEDRRFSEGGGRIKTSRGMVELTRLIRSLILQGQRDHSLDLRVNDAALAAAILGSAEAIIRDRAIAARAGRSCEYSYGDATSVFEFLLRVP